MSIETLSIIAIVIIVGSLIVPFWKRLPVCYVIIITNMLLFFLVIGGHSFEEGKLIPSPSFSVVEDLGYAQAEFGHHPHSIITAMYVHGGVLHLMMNMLFLALIGAPFEERVGRRNFFIIYILSGIGASLFSGIFEPHIYGIGASGAIFGIMGAFALKYPDDEIPLFLVFIFLPRVPVYVAVFVYGGLETGYAAAGVQDGVGHMAHIGGLAFGVFMAAVVVKKKKEQYFDSLIFKTIADETEKEEYITIAQEIEKADEKDVRDAWIDEFFEKVGCPLCGKQELKMSKEGIGCDCGYVKRFDEIRIRD